MKQPGNARLFHLQELSAKSDGMFTIFKTGYRMMTESPSQQAGH